MPTIAGALWLEPCSFDSPEKHQPACTRSIIKARIAHVIIGQLDPNPRVRGNGVRRLREAGVEVTISPNSARFWLFNSVFNTVMALGRPFVHIKAAISLDGRIAATNGGQTSADMLAAMRERHPELYAVSMRERHPDLQALSMVAEDER